jgi:flavodoxin
MTSHWGPPTWKFLHTLAEKIKEDSFTVIKPQLIQFLINICKNLPCPSCSQHATSLITRANFNNVKTKQDLKNVLYMMHNAVNRQKNKPIYNYELLDATYSKNKFVNTYNHFINVFKTKGNMALMSDSLHRQLLTNQLKTWLQKNLNHFDLK